MISRIAKLINLSQQYKAIAVIGPRQSGKTTLYQFSIQMSDKISFFFTY
jgi:predicted AAA+ superfamily ATPase